MSLSDIFVCLQNWCKTCQHLCTIYLHFFKKNFGLGSKIILSIISLMQFLKYFFSACFVFRWFMDNKNSYYINTCISANHILDNESFYQAPKMHCNALDEHFNHTLSHFLRHFLFRFFFAMLLFSSTGNNCPRHSTSVDAAIFKAMNTLDSSYNCYHHYPIVALGVLTARNIIIHNIASVWLFHFRKYTWLWAERDIQEAIVYNTAWNVKK